MADNTPKTPEDSLIWTIRDRAKHWELPTAYIAAIARDKFGTDNLHALTLEQLDHLLYTVQARGRRRTAKTAERFEIDAPAEVHTSRSTVPPSRLKDWRGDIDASPRPTRHKRSAAPKPPPHDGRFFALPFLTYLQIQPPAAALFLKYTSLGIGQPKRLLFSLSAPFSPFLPPPASAQYYPWPGLPRIYHVDVAYTLAST